MQEQNPESVNTDVSTEQFLKVLREAAKRGLDDSRSAEEELETIVEVINNVLKDD